MFKRVAQSEDQQKYE